MKKYKIILPIICGSSFLLASFIKQPIAKKKISRATHKKNIGQELIQVSGAINATIRQLTSLQDTITQMGCSLIEQPKGTFFSVADSNELEQCYITLTKIHAHLEANTREACNVMQEFSMKIKDKK